MTVTELRGYLESLEAQGKGDLIVAYSTCFKDRWTDDEIGNIDIQEGKPGDRDTPCDGPYVRVR